MSAIIVAVTLVIDVTQAASTSTRSSNNKDSSNSKRLVRRRRLQSKSDDADAYVTYGDHFDRDLPRPPLDLRQGLGEEILLTKKSKSEKSEKSEKKYEERQCRALLQHTEHFTFRSGNDINQCCTDGNTLRRGE
mmetsp:Transcript_53059/g.59310  ORF Transcript_53059/g.59310 Transcript_53059/m.59310 type:complete len:134 (+) Transcript_53059:2-403(+)